MKKLFKQKKGITLIALVITIIVLLILAGISISMLSGDNGILQKAKDAKTFSERESVVEQARTDVLGYQTENQGGDLDKSQLKSVLDKYFDEVPDLTDMEKDAILNRELHTLSKYGTHTIAVYEIYNGDFLNTKSNKKLVDLITESTMYGYRVINYNANGISNWSVLYNNGNNVYIISDDYITEDLSELPHGLSEPEAFLNDYSKWTQYVDQNILEAKAYGAPTGQMLLQSYNSKYGTNFKLTDYPTFNTYDPLYVVTNQEKKMAYLLSVMEGELQVGKNNFIRIASNFSENIESDIYNKSKYFLAAAGNRQLFAVGYDGTSAHVDYNNSWCGLRCCVCIPNQTTGTIDTSNHCIKIDK